MKELTPRDIEVLNELESAKRRGWGMSYGDKDGWCRPMDVGGRSGSHHSPTLTKLAEMGYAEQRTRGLQTYKRGRARGSKVYRISEAGETIVRTIRDRENDNARVGTEL